jgi:oxalate decarboxylase/phosphoglucose isomerase-like protein (cupin superfamily)
VQSPIQYTFKMEAMAPTKRTTGGEIRIVDSHNFPVSKNVAAALNTIKPGGMRELHWHPNASEWQFYMAGKGRMTVFMPVGSARTMGCKSRQAIEKNGGASRARTDDLIVANDALSQLSYSPTCVETAK